MAVENTTIMILVGITFIYLVIYQKNKFFGNMGYMLISIAAWYTGTTDTEKIIGVVMFFGSIINMIYDIITSN